MLNSSEINALGSVCDTTWGNSSTTESPTMSIKTSLSGDTMTVLYTTIVHFASEQAMSQQMDRFSDESAKLTNDYMKKVRKEFKEIAGRALKVKQLSSNDSVEITYTSPYSPRKIAYYRRVTTFKVD